MNPFLTQLLAVFLGAWLFLASVPLVRLIRRGVLNLRWWVIERSYDWRERD